MAPLPKHDNPTAFTGMMLEQHTAKSDSSSMDDIIFVRSVEKRRAPKIGGDHPTKRAKSNNIPAQAVSPSPAAKEPLSSNGTQATASDAYLNPKVPLPGQQEPEQQESFLLATRNALEQALGKETLERNEKLLAKEQESTEQYIANLETALKQQIGAPAAHNAVLQSQIARLKVKAEGQDEAARTEIKILRENNVKLKDEKTALVRSVKLLQEEHDTLKNEISALSQDICEQKKLRESKKIRRYERAIKDAAAQSKKSKKKLVQRNHKLIEKNTDLSARLVELEAGHSAEVLDAHKRIEKLQDQVDKLEQGFRQRGEQLIELSRDTVSKDKIKVQKKAAIEAKGLLQTRMSGMFKNYRDLFKKNTALLDKLVSVAEAGRFGNVGRAYRQELKLLKGQPLEELYEFKHQV